MTHLGTDIQACFILNRPGRFQVGSLSGIPKGTFVRYEHEWRLIMHDLSESYTSQNMLRLSEKRLLSLVICWRNKPRWGWQRSLMCLWHSWRLYTSHLSTMSCLPGINCQHGPVKHKQARSHLPALTNISHPQAISNAQVPAISVKGSSQSFNVICSILRGQARGFFKNTDSKHWQVYIYCRKPAM